MSEEVLYRKYRPIQFTDLVGQDVVCESLAKQAKKGSFAHAYMLVGQYGSGKTSIARILASVMTCKNRKPGSDKACGKCDSCLAIRNGHCSDVLEIDAASNNGVDQIRELRKEARYAPAELERKIYILDECHMLTTQACNAILKILEEPPDHLVFILCTTEMNKMLGTILSRCQKWDFLPIPSELAAVRLGQVAQREGIELAPGVARTIARLGKGSMRDSLGNLEQVATYADNNVTPEAVSKFFRIPERRITYEIVKMISEENPSGMLMKLNDLIIACVPPKVILAEVADVLRCMFLVKYCGEDTSLLDLDEEESRVLVELSKKMTNTMLVNIASSFVKIERQIAVNISERWILEAALINCILIVTAEAKKK